jgi:hypothetical protein
MSAEDRIWMICDVAGSENMLIGGLSVFVDDDSIIDGQAGDCRKFIIRADANANDHNIRGNDGTVIANDPFDPPISVKAGDRCTEPQFNSLALVNVSKKSAHLRRYDAIHYGPISLDYCDVAPATAGGRRYFQTDETAAYNDQISTRSQIRTDQQHILDCSKIKNVREFTARHVEFAHP